MSQEVDSMRALALEANETVTLTKEFYRCIVKDPRTRSGDAFKAVRPEAMPIPLFPEEGDGSKPAP